MKSSTLVQSVSCYYETNHSFTIDLYEFEVSDVDRWPRHNILKLIRVNVNDWKFLNVQIFRVFNHFLKFCLNCHTFWTFLYFPHNCYRKRFGILHSGRKNIFLSVAHWAAKTTWKNEFSLFSTFFLTLGLWPYICKYDAVLKRVAVDYV